MEKSMSTLKGRLSRRRLMTTGLSAIAGLGLLPLALSLSAQGADQPMIADPKLLFVALPPIMVPGRDRFAYIRLELKLELRQTPNLAQESANVTAFKPRLIGVITEMLDEEKPVDRHSGPEKVQAMKSRIRDLVNATLGKPMVQDVLIVSLLTG
jgi:Flagellar basal body-associated protein FliL